MIAPYSRKRRKAILDREGYQLSQVLIRQFGILSIMSASSTRTYPKATHRKVEGSLVLTDESLTFHPELNDNGGGNVDLVVIRWQDVEKHQITPASHPKCMLKLVLRSSRGKGPAFVLPNRYDLDRIRLDVTGRLVSMKKARSVDGRRPMFDETSDRPSSASASGSASTSESLCAQFADLDPDALAVTRSSLLSSDPSLRAQHKHLVTETETLSETDFWKTHSNAIYDEYARIHGRLKPGQSSTIKSSLDLGPRGRVRLGVEEMRQIFVMYPAVHKAYEEKVPLELSEEQFWRRYLESEFFHRDRGRIGAHVGKLANEGEREKEEDGGDGVDKGDEKGGHTSKEDEAAARVAAAGSNDLFSRYESELRGAKRRRGGVTGATNRLAIGQFDLAATAETERGGRILNATDLFPSSSGGGSNGDKTASRVVDKYNRHWAMVLNPDDATAGCDLIEVARLNSGNTAADNHVEAKVNGGADTEMRRLVGFANATEETADHMHCKGENEFDDEEAAGLYEELHLRNVGAYSGNVIDGSRGSSREMSSLEAIKRRSVFSKKMALVVKDMVAPLLQEDITPSKINHTFPPPAMGKELLAALTKKMAQDSQSDADVAKVTNLLPEDFKKKLNSYFRRSSELLRHFFGLRHLMETHPSNSDADTMKLAKIVKGMENVYREMEIIRKGLPLSKSGEIMRKMCLPIMHQLDYAFKLNRDGAGGGGGFVTVEAL